MRIRSPEQHEKRRRNYHITVHVDVLPACRHRDQDIHTGDDRNYSYCKTLYLQMTTTCRIRTAMTLLFVARHAQKDDDDGSDTCDRAATAMMFCHSPIKLESHF